MDEQKTRDQIDIELSRTYFGNTEGKTQLSPQEPEKTSQEKAQQEKVQDVPQTVRKRWSPLTILFILWIISSLIFAAGYFLHGKRIIFSVNINVEPDTTVREKAQPPKFVQDLLVTVKQTSSDRKIQLSLPGAMRPSQKTIAFMPPETMQDLAVKIKEAFSSRKIEFLIPEKTASKKTEPAPVRSMKQSLKPVTSKPAVKNVKTLYDFEFTEDGWEIPSWELDKPDHVARSLKMTDAAANKGSGGLELIAEFPGDQWTAALIEVQQYLDLRNYDNIQADIYIPADCPDGLKCKLILTVGENWQFVEMSRSVRLVPGEWTTIDASISEGSSDWKRTTVDDAFKSDVRKISLRIESNRKPAYSGPIYIDNVRVTSY